MDREQVIARLKAYERELRAAGVIQLSLFGSVARGEAGPESDVDVAVKLDPSHRIDLFQFYGLAERLESLLDAKVDLISEPVERAALRERIERDRARVF
jgi:uncharacterized protein